MNFKNLGSQQFEVEKIVASIRRDKNSMAINKLNIRIVGQSEEKVSLFL